jgi:hypothetical protein
MTSKTPDFYLASSESRAFRGPHKCWIEGVVTGEVRQDYLLVRLEPFVTDFQTKQPIERVLLAGRSKSIKGAPLPISVYIAKIKNQSVIQTWKCSASSIEVVTSGDIFSSAEQATAFAANAS